MSAALDFWNLREARRLAYRVVHSKTIAAAKRATCDLAAHFELAAAIVTPNEVRVAEKPPHPGDGVDIEDFDTAVALICRDRCKSFVSLGNGVFEVDGQRHSKIGIIEMAERIRRRERRTAA